MRGFVCCADCGLPMASTWAKGRNDYYAYYMCRQKGCPSDKKAIATGKIETALENLMQSLTPSQELFNLASEIFRGLWDSRGGLSKSGATQMRVEIGNVENLISKLLDRLVKAETTTVISAYERKVEKLERKKSF